MRPRRESFDYRRRSKVRLLSGTERNGLAFRTGRFDTGLKLDCLFGIRLGLGEGTEEMELDKYTSIFMHNLLIG